MNFDDEIVELKEQLTGKSDFDSPTVKRLVSRYIYDQFRNVLKDVEGKCK